MPNIFTRREVLLSCAMTAVNLAFKPFTKLNSLQDKPVFLRVAVQLVNVYLEPDFNSSVLTSYARDELVHALSLVQPEPATNTYWYRVDDGYMPSAYLQPVGMHINDPLDRLPEDGILTQVSVPFTQALRYHELSDWWEPIYRLYYDSNHWIQDIVQGPDGGIWYRILDHYHRTYYAAAAHLRPIPDEELAPISPELPHHARHIEVRLSDQTLTAFEENEPVRQARISSGRPQKQPPPEGEIPTDTPLGNFHITVKTPVRHMGDTPMTDDLEAHSYPGVPWICFFHESGVSLHGTYWHNNFGRRLSSGCINLKCADALWLYRWTEPVIKPGERQVSSWGTRVSIVE